ncbi:MAG: tetratricopeptide repeat protein [Acidobacteria bacterium]|nr:tetratricopeptide repeat protein [Acidobacteriota bacterium]
MAKAKTFFEQATALDPNYALPHLGLSEYYWLCTFWTYIHAREGLPHAKEAAERALRCDPDLAEAHAMLGVLKGSFDLDWEAAEREFRRARELDPASVAVRDRYASSYLRPLGRLEEAAAELEGALEVDPLSLFLHYHLVYVHHLSRRYDRAVAVAESALALDPDYFPLIWVLGVTHAICGRLEQALALCRRATELSGRSPMMIAAMATTLALMGRKEEGRSIIDELHRWAEVRPVPAVCFVWFHIAAGELEKALEWIERGIEERHPILVLQLRSEPFFDGLRPDPRFQVLLHKLRIA